MSGQPWGHWNSPQPPNQQEQQNQGYYTGYPGQQQQQQQQHQAQHAPHDYQMQRGPQQQHQQQYHHQQQQQGRPQLQHYQSHQAMYGVSPHQQQYRQHQQQQHVMQQMHHQHQYHGNPQHHQPPPPQQQQHPHPHQFMFNPNANVFVPGGRYGMPPPQQQQQQYYGGGAMHSNMHSFQPNYGAPQSSGYNMYQEDPPLQGFDAFAQFGQQSQQYMPSPELFALMQGNASSLLNEILVGCEQLLAEGEEDSATWTAAIRQRFADAKMDEEAKRTGVKLIVEMAFSMEPNQFRGTDPQYTFSNLLKTLAAELKDFLRDVVLPVLGEINEARKSLEHDSRVYLAVFYAELFVKLTLNNGSRFEKLGDALATQIDEILKFQQKDDYMKCLLRAFKVAGAELDASETLRTRVDQILTTMGGYAKGSPILGESVKAQILSLIECRQRGWDRSVTSGVETTSSSGGAASGVVYGDDSFDESLDNELTEEERQFLESHLEQAERNDSQAAGGGGDELDEQEVMNEFGKFVKEELLKAEEAKTADLLSNLSVNDEPAEEAAAEQQPEQH